MIKAFGTTLAAAAAVALGASAEAQATPANHVNRGIAAGALNAGSGRHHRAARARSASGYLPLGLSNVGSSFATVTWGGSSTASATAASTPNGASASTATSASVYVNGRLIDTIPASGADSYQLQQLWPSSTFRTGVILRSAAGRIVGNYNTTFTTAASSGPAPRLYSPDTFINTPIGADPSIAPNSSEMVSQAFESYTSTAAIANNNSWGIPVYQASPDSPEYTVGCEYYDCWVPFGPIHIPADAQPNWGSDGHMVVMQPDGSEMDMWIAQRTSDGWTSGSRWETSAYGSAANCTRVHGCGGADVAGFALAAGLIRPEEIAQGHIDHALAITTPDTRAGYIACPATNTDGRHDDPNALPIGAHVQLDPSIDVSKLHLPRWEKVIAVALQQYGAYVIDTGGAVALYAESTLDRPYNAWWKAGVPSDSPSLSNMPWNAMRVLSMTDCSNS